MKIGEVRQQDTNDLRTKLREADEQMFRLKLQIGMGQTEGLKKYRTLRRDKARMLTVLTEREGEK
ncbi:MAG: 50S ribosomal protein L29 [Bryobacteraceae bacterium]